MLYRSIELSSLLSINWGELSDCRTCSQKHVNTSIENHLVFGKRYIITKEKNMTT